MKITEETKQHPLSREDVAQIEVGHTDISSGLARFLTVFFLAAIVLVPVIQHVGEFLQYRAGERPSPIPQSWYILRSARDAAYMLRHSPLAPYDRVFAVNRELLREIEQYADRLEEESWLTERVLPAAQLALSCVFGMGNEKVYLGRGGWLFFKPAIDYLTDHGFLTPHHWARRAASVDGSTPPQQPDPVQAIVQFHTQLAARGIELIVVPVPVKATVHPGQFAGYTAREKRAIHNASYAQFLAALEAQKVRVFDPTDRLAAFARTQGAPAFLATDTHWTPAAMESVAAALAGEILPLLPATSVTAAFHREASAVTNLGDLGELLKLPDDSRWLAPETVEIHPVRPAADSKARVIDPSAEVLLLGDSFANIFALESMDWGVSAGFAEHLALALNRPVDAIRRNDAGAYATREVLARELAGGYDRLAGKKVVIWEFAARELALGDWKLLDLNPVAAQAGRLFGADGLRAVTGAHARMVWMQAIDPASIDIFGRRDNFRLMGTDTDDGFGVREILPGPLSCRKPMLTPDGRRVVCTDFPRARIFVVNWDGTGRRYLSNGYATDVLNDPATGRTWVYAITGPLSGGAFSGRPLIRFDLDRPDVRETVWDQTDVSLDNFHVSDDGRHAAGQFPWPQAGIADLAKGTWAPLGNGCWTSLAPDGSGAWFFDGPHRNLLFQDSKSSGTRTIPIHVAPDIRGFEVYHPRWSNHRQFFCMSGPYHGGEADIGIFGAGREVEIYAGRFSADFQRVERWVKVTLDEQPDFFPDLWIDPSRPVAFDPADIEAASAVAVVAAGPIVVDARLTALTPTPTLRSIAPYRQALVVFSYEIVKLHQGTDPGPSILVHHWAIRNDRNVAPGTRVGETVRLAVEPFAAHAELQGERVIKAMEGSGLPMFYEPPR